MPKVTIEVPKELAEAVSKVAAELEAGLAAIGSGKPLDFAEWERRAAASAAEVERAMVRRLLRGLDVDAPHVRVDGRLHARVGRYPATYRTQAGPVEVERSLYREVGVRNGPTVDAVSVRAGCVQKGWLPETAKAMAYLVGCGTSREAEGTSCALHRLPYSRSSFEEVAHAVGTLYGAQRVHVEAALVQALEVPRGAHSVSLSLDRVALPMEEPKARPVGRPRTDAPERPVDVVFRMAYAACLTFHDEQGQALSSLRSGRMPEGDVEGLCARLALHTQAALLQQPSLHVAVLTDGAPEMHQRLDEALAKHASAATAPVRLVDFWHLMEKLGAASLLLAGDHAWALRERWKMSLLNKPGAIWRIASELHESGKHDVVVGDGRPVHEALTYLENHGERMHYAEARKAGLPIGSGNVEATCKSLIGVRMKRPGSRWKHESGQHVIDLRSLVLSDCWDTAMDLTLAPLRAQVRRAA
jgi:hypothetical protein